MIFDREFGCFAYNTTKLPTKIHYELKDNSNL